MELGLRLDWLPASIWTGLHRELCLSRHSRVPVLVTPGLGAAGRVVLPLRMAPPCNPVRRVGSREDLVDEMVLRLPVWALRSVVVVAHGNSALVALEQPDLVQQLLRLPRHDGLVVY